MGNRMLKDSIRTSKTVNSMTDFQFRVWVYLITYVDDYGRGSADPELIKGFVFPRRKRISESDIEKALADLAGMGCIHLYDVDGESYFCFPNWGKHQRIQTKRSLFPAPEDGPDDKSTVGHGESPSSTVGHGESPSEVETEVETEIEIETELESEAYASSAEPETGSAPPVILLPLNDGTDYAVSHAKCQEWAGLYPSVDVAQQLRNMRGWLEGNPAKRKTKRGITGFIHRWLAKEQDRGGSKRQPDQKPATPGENLARMKKYLAEQSGGDP